MLKKLKYRQFPMSVSTECSSAAAAAAAPDPRASLSSPVGKVEPWPQRYPSLLQLSPCDLMEMRVAGTLPSGLYCPLGQNGSEEKPEKRRLVVVEGLVLCVCV